MALTDYQAHELAIAADERAAEEMQEDDEDDPAQEVKWEDDGGFESARDLQADENATKAQSKKAVKVCLGWLQCGRMGQAALASLP